MAVGDYLMMKVIGRVQQQNIVNSLCWEISEQASTDAQICAGLAVDFETEVKTVWQLAHSDDYMLVGIKVYSLTGDPKIPGQNVVEEQGSVVGDLLPAYVCRTITLYPSDVDMKHRGRIMLSGTVVGMLDAADGGLTSAAIILLDNIADVLLAGIGSGGDSYDLRIWGKDDEEPPAPAAHAIARADGRRTPSSVTSRRIRELLIG